MNQEQRDLIRERLSQLVLYTDCNTDLITYFHQNRILTPFDIEEIEAQNAGGERATEFYKTIATRVGAFKNLLEGLEKYGQFNALRILTGKAGDKIELSREEVKARVAKLVRERPSKSNVFFNVPPPVQPFTGRGKELDELHELVWKSKERERVTVISQLVIIGGPQGIGKTQFAREYASKKGSEFDGNVVWLDAETEASLQNSFRKFVSEKISSNQGNRNEKEGKTIAEEVYQYFEGSFALFIFDNGKKGGSWLRGFLPDPIKNKNFYTLMTSRDTQWGIGAKVLNLKEIKNS